MILQIQVINREQGISHVWYGNPVPNLEWGFQ